MNEQTALGNWRLTLRGKEVFTKPRIGVLRSKCDGNVPLVGSRTGAGLRRCGLSVAPRFLWE